jgi:hypothetical protein
MASAEAMFWATLRNMSSGSSMALPFSSRFKYLISSIRLALGVKTTWALDDTDNLFPPDLIDDM